MTARTWRRWSRAGSPWWLAWLLLAAALAGCTPTPAPSSAAVTTLVHAQAVRAGWDSTAPPAEGWQDVTLLDYWDQRWPQHDGVVWYRLRWHQRDAQQPLGLLVSYACLGKAVYLNGSLIARDRSLVEPLTRSWVRPFYALVDAPLLRQGDNELLVRVSGLAAYQPGLGTVSIGDPEAVHALYRRAQFERYDIKLVTLAISIVLGLIFLLLWLLRRQDSVYGWFALTELSGTVYASNHLLDSPWPFPTTDGWQAFIAAAYLASAGSYALFLLRFAEARRPRLERLLGVCCVAGIALALLLPGWFGPHRDLLIVPGGVIFYAAIGWFGWTTLRAPRIDRVVLGLCLLLPVLVSFHDYAVFFGWWRDDTYLLSFTAALSLLGIAFALAHRFVAAMRRIEGFNAELQHEVDAATGQLSDTLQREHALALASSRAHERLNLVRDVHDGFGGTLIGAIGELEAMDGPPDPQALAQRLRELRDDLRLIIDSTEDADAELETLLAPLRHRWMQRLERAGIDVSWTLEADAARLRPGSAAALDLMRLVQEALTNVLKHSRARRVELRLGGADGRLELDIRDDGVGFAATAASQRGAGLPSLRARAQRLGHQLRIDSAPDAGTWLSLRPPPA